MGAKTKIDWCDSTWNPITGCLHGCEYCYARKIVQRFDGGWRRDYLPYPVLDEPYKQGGRTQPYPYGFLPTFHKYKLNELNKWKKPKNIFVCSMADMFGNWVPESWIDEVFTACKNNPQNNYLFLTKNWGRYFELQSSRKLPNRNNTWYGITVTNTEYIEDIDFDIGRLQLGTKTFLSIEPISEFISKNTDFKRMIRAEYFDWVIVGAETGNRKGKIVPERRWIEGIVNLCRRYKIPIFMKSSLAEIWGEPLIQEFPAELKKGYGC